MTNSDDNEVRPSNRGIRGSESPDQRSIAVANNRVDSRDLFQGRREITIAHGEETYRLRLTGQNKLILTK